MSTLNPAHWLGVAFRRLGTVTAIGHVRKEHTIRRENHGGEITELNQRMTEFSRRVCSEVADAEKRLLG